MYTDVSLVSKWNWLSSWRMALISLKCQLYTVVWYKFFHAELQSLFRFVFCSVWDRVPQSLGWPQTHHEPRMTFNFWSFYLYPHPPPQPRAGTMGVCHHIWLLNFLRMKEIDPLLCRHCERKCRSKQLQKAGRHSMLQPSCRLFEVLYSNPVLQNNSRNTHQQIISAMKTMYDRQEI